jgi:hypothetical protein
MVIFYLQVAAMQHKLFKTLCSNRVTRISDDGQFIPGQIPCCSCPLNPDAVSYRSLVPSDVSAILYGLNSLSAKNRIIARNTA